MSPSRYSESTKGYNEDWMEWRGSEMEAGGPETAKSLVWNQLGQTTDSRGQGHLLWREET